jgi:phenylpropionate dioxygenase-like ring-hydroxylating dioxygenase large terminal subunit
MKSSEASSANEQKVRAACEQMLRRGFPAHSAPDQGSLAALLDDVAACAALPLNRSRTLPAEVYTSEVFYRWEEEHLFRAEWVCAAHESQIANIGDFLTLELLGEPLLVLRDKDSRVRVLSRACPHRGMDIMPPGFDRTPPGGLEGAGGAGNTGLLRCPYHSWTFDLDGRLKACPEMHKVAEFDRGDWGLKAFRAATWHGFVFVNLDGAALRTPAEQWADLDPHLAMWSGQDLFVADARSWECPFNWKVITENFMESYHHAGAHLRTLQPIMPARDTWTEQEHPHYVRCHLPYCARQRTPGSDAGTGGPSSKALPLIPGLPERERFEWGLILGFPTLLLATVPDGLIWYRIQPEGPHRHTLQTSLLLPRSVSKLPDYEQRHRAAAEASVEFHLEDMEMCAGVQRSYYSSGYQRGRLSHLEMPIWLLQRYLAARARGSWPAMDAPPAPSQRAAS